MGRNRTKLLFLAFITLLVPTQVLAHAIVSNGRIFRAVGVGAWVPGGPAACLEGAVDSGSPPSTLTRICHRVSGANVAYARATAGPGRSKSRVAFVRGLGLAGLTTSAVGDTLVLDSLVVSYNNTGANQTTVTINGLMYYEPASGRFTRNTSTVLVYPNQQAAENDPQSTGQGALFNGALTVMMAANAPPKIDAHGGFSLADFSIQNLSGNRVAIRANNLTKVVAVPDTGSVIVRSGSDPAVDAINGLPLHSTASMAGVALALTAAALAYLRRRQARLF